MRDHDRRISAHQLNNGAQAIRRRLAGQRFRLFTRVAANIGVYTSGNEMRMGGGKGSFDHWAARVAVSQIVFELKGDLHEQVVKDAFRLAGNKLPGMTMWSSNVHANHNADGPLGLYEFVKKGDPPMMGLTKLEAGVTIQNMKPMRPKLPLETTAGRIPASTPAAPPP